MTIVPCPECTMPATATSRGDWDSTEGPVPHVCVVCVSGHHFLGLAESLLPSGTEQASTGDRPVTGLRQG